MNKSFGNYVMIDPEEVPTKKELETTISRLEKTIGFLEKMPNDKWPHEHLKKTLSFLKLMATRIKD
ncbi:MAG: hypothetical protein HWN81_00245 [Candidatus Lokiarchaeota archaeon]|nr:hypothetical protein [Candidatus Lokiarchaeota archaeon]